MLEITNKILWAGATVLIVSMGLYFTYKLKFVQFQFKEMFHNLCKKETRGIKPHQTLMMVLAGRIGVGSIAGVALSIYLGGIGSLFWMWIIAFISSALSFAETTLGILYKEKDETENDIYKGGPSYYLSKGIHKPFLGTCYALLVLVSYVFGFLGIQANTITKSLQEIFPLSPIVIGIIIVLLTSVVIIGGVSKIANTASKLVPVMMFLYIGVALFICIQNIEQIPIIFLNIVKSAFHVKPFLSGFLGALIVGVQRGIFSNEAGLGTGAIASSTVTTEDAAGQGYLQMIGIYITTLLICTSTAIIILTSPYDLLNLHDINGIEITQFAFEYHLGRTGSYLIFLSIILFSFSTILTGYYDGESSLKYLFKKVKQSHLLFLKIITLFILFVGCLLSSTFLWNLVDVMVALLAFINIYALFSLRTEVLTALSLYRHKKRSK